MKSLRKNWAEILVLICLFICFVALLFYFRNFGKNGLSDKSASWGVFGDYVGGLIGTILSFFSIILIYVTYKNQVNFSIKQQFDSTFFNLLQTQREILKTLKGTFVKERKGVVCIADEYINAVAEELYESYGGDNGIILNTGPIVMWKPEYNSEQQNLPKESPEELNKKGLKFICDIYENVHKGKEAELGHYFRHLYHLVKFVHESNIKEKKKYMDFIQAQMSDDELYVTFYNSISRFGVQKFSPLLNEYGFFENISNKRKLNKLVMEHFYNKTIFKYHIPSNSD